MPYIFYQSMAPQYQARLLLEPNLDGLKLELSRYNEAHALDDNGFPTSLLRDGIKFPGIPLPASVVADRPGSKPMRIISDALSVGPFNAVSSKIRDVIHVLEPDVHQFEKFHIYTSRSREASLEYYVWIIGDLKRSGVVDFDRTDFPVTTDSNGKRIQKPAFSTQSERIFLHKSAVTNGHAWRSAELSQSIVISDELYERLNAAKVIGVEFLRLNVS